MTKLNTINCGELMTEPLKPIEFVVDNLITQGLFILAGAPKIGKSWLALDICLSVAKGEPVLNAKTAQGTSLYLCLEDSRIRIQNRLYEMTDEPTEHLKFALLANSICSGLEEQIERFISEHRDTKIIFIDTLQKSVPTLPTALTQPITENCLFSKPSQISTRLLSFWYITCEKQRTPIRST